MTIKKLEHYTTLLYLFSSAFNSISYLIFVIALWWLYIIPHCNKIKCITCILSCLSSCIYFILHYKKREGKEKDIKPLHPFDDDPPKYPGKSNDHDRISKEDNETTTQQNPQTFFLYILALVVYVLIIVVMDSVVAGKFSKHPPK